MISLSGGIGSGSNTSSPATMSPRFRRAIRASLSTTAPRDTFTNTELEWIRSNSRRPIIPSVAGV